MFKEVEKRGLQVAVAGIPKTIDNDIAVSSDKPSFIIGIYVEFSCNYPSSLALRLLLGLDMVGV